jgi:DMSO/TMAO reductase YedYZ molybdopterin-dependent catalytic subunit
MKKKLFLILLLVISFWLIGFSFLGQVLSTDSSGSHKDTLTAVSESTLILVDGGVGHPLNLTYSELVAMPRSTVSAELVCPGFFTMNGNWTGVRLWLVLEKAGFDTNASTVNFSAQDGYQVSLSITDAEREDVIIAYEKDGAPLPETTRLVIPGTTGGQWISNITEIALPSSNGGSSIAFPIAITAIVIVTAASCMILKRKRGQSNNEAT